MGRARQTARAAMGGQGVTDWWQPGGPFRSLLALAVWVLFAALVFFRMYRRKR
jgi:hypothetical protein